MNDDTTPVLLKRDGSLPWNEASLFYVLTADGLFACRNHEFFESCVPARRWPAELARQEPFLVPDFPRLAVRDLERMVAFFGFLADEHGAEGAVLLYWDRRRRRVRLVVPPQTARVSRGWSGRAWPLSLEYERPTALPAHWVPFGDAHSHAYQDAYCSGQDLADEAFSTGVHLVVGRLDREPPAFHVEAVVDGTRFEMELADVVEAGDDGEVYRRRRERAPRRWLERVTVRDGWSAGSTWGSGVGWSSGGAR